MSRIFSAGAFLIVVGLAIGCSKRDSSLQMAREEISSRSPETCEQFIARLPSNYTYNYVHSVEEPGNFASPTVKVFFYYPKDLKENVTLFLNGGPGETSHGGFQNLDRALVRYGISDKVSFVFMDQRGNGCSSGYPEEATDEKISKRARWYGSRGIVYDAELIRQQFFGNRKWNIFGQSFGAFVAHRYLVNYLGSLDRTLAYANAVTDDPKDRMYNRVKSQFQVWDRYFAAYPEDKIRVRALLEGLPKERCQKLPSGKQFCGTDQISDLVDYELGFTHEWSYLHDTLKTLVPQQIDATALTNYVIRQDYPSPTNARRVSLKTINYYDRNVLPLDYPLCQEISKRLKKEIPSVDFSSYLTECSPAMQFQDIDHKFAQIQIDLNHQQDKLTLKDVGSALNLSPHGRVFLYSGDLDPWIPPVLFTEEVAELGGQIFYRPLIGVGHEGYYTERIVFEDLVN